VGRFGGDEFVIVSAGLDLAGASGLADAIVRAVSQSLRLNAIDLFPEISMGVAIYPEHGVTGSDLLRRADIAMYEAKQARAPVASYSHGSDATYLRRLSLVNDLRRAIGNDELRLHYQPKIEIGNEWPTHVEALVRWQHPVEGLLGPDEFIPLAEHAGSIHLVTRWVLRHVLQQCREWDDAGFSLGVAVNLSAIDLAVDNLPASSARSWSNSASRPNDCCSRSPRARSCATQNMRSTC
jgi:predicted signal transduction protein with EAL and GGDEF domain